MEHLRHSWSWYALVVVGAYRLIATGLDSLVRLLVTTSQATPLRPHYVSTFEMPICHCASACEHHRPDVSPAPRPPACFCCGEVR